MDKNSTLVFSSQSNLKPWWKRIFCSPWSRFVIIQYSNPKEGQAPIVKDNWGRYWYLNEDHKCFYSDARPFMISWISNAEIYFRMVAFINASHQIHDTALQKSDPIQRGDYNNHKD
jgi:hypothetical protein